MPETVVPPLSVSELPRLPMFELAESSMLVILEGIVYVIGATKFGENGDLCYRIHPWATLEDMFQDFGDTHRRIFELYKNNFIYNFVSKRISQSDEIKSRLAAKSVVDFLLYSVRPYMLENSQNNSDEFETPSGQSQALLEILQTQQFESVARPPAFDMLSLQIPNSILINEMAFPLLSSNSINSSGFKLVSSNQTWIMASRGGTSLKDLEAQFMDTLEQTLKNEAMAEFPVRMQQLEMYCSEELLLASRAGLFDECQNQMSTDCLYRDDLWAIQQYSQTWYVTLAVPRYAVEDNNHNLYVFDATFVGLPIKSCLRSEILKSGQAKVMTPYAHMFIAEASTPFQSICMVNANSASYFNAMSSWQVAEAICQYLSDARQTLMAGHHAANSTTPYHRIDSFSDRLISQESAEQQQLPIFPYYR